MRNAAKKKSTTVAFEALEHRELMSATPILSELNYKTYSTSPSNGDLNPYGIAFVPDNVATGGKLAKGDVLVSNFNNNTNAQGTGTTIEEIAPNGTTSTFFQGTEPMGLDAGLQVLSKGFVLVGNVPANSQGTPAATGSSILILDKNGKLVDTLNPYFGLLDGAWDFQAIEQNGGSKVQLFVSNALSGTVDRVTLTIPNSGDNIGVTSVVQIASGYTHGPNAAAFIVGPAGVAYDSSNGNLYVNSEGDNAVYAIPNAMTTLDDNGKGTLIYNSSENLHGPLGLILANNGNLILANSDATSPVITSELVEITTKGKLVDTKSIDPAAGGAFNIAESFTDGMHRFAYVDDNTATLTIYNLANNTAPLLPQLIAQKYSTAVTGDLNPYGVTFVPSNFPASPDLAPGDLLVSNFNDSGNNQGTGTSIIRIHDGVSSVFFTDDGLHQGLDAGLAVLSRGFVLVGNINGVGNPTVPGTNNNNIQILNNMGQEVGHIGGSSFLQGPWDFTTVEQNNGATVQLFVSSALSGEITRFTLSVPSSGDNIQVTGMKIIASGYSHGPNANNFIEGPAGLAYDAANGDLYVASEQDNAIYAISNALTTNSNNGRGKSIFSNTADLNGPLGLILASDGDLIIANADTVATGTSNLTEITTTGELVTNFAIDPTAGGAFNIAESFTLGEHRFAYVDDVTATVTIVTLPG